MTMKLMTAVILAVSLSTLATSPRVSLADEQKQQKADSHAGHAHADDKVYQGYFDDVAVRARPFSDYEGSWQSVYPLLSDGTLDPVMEAKSKKGDKTAAEYKAYYETGYKTDVSQVIINGEEVQFLRGADVATAKYQEDGYDILTYKKGNRGVRFSFKKISGDDAAPAFIQFSDHRIAPSKADHFHLYWGDDRSQLLKEVTHWPTYYPVSLSATEILEEMLAH